MLENGPQDIYFNNLRNLMHQVHKVPPPPVRSPCSGTYSERRAQDPRRRAKFGCSISEAASQAYHLTGETVEELDHRTLRTLCLKVGKI